MMDKVKDDLGVHMNFTNARPCTRGIEKQQNYQGTHMGSISDCHIKHYRDNLSGIFGADSSKSVKSIPSQRRNITVL
jgi:hypothetical protein